MGGNGNSNTCEKGSTIREFMLVVNWGMNISNILQYYATTNENDKLWSSWEFQMGINSTEDKSLNRITGMANTNFPKGMGWMNRCETLCTY